jgi:hypothetical protein
MAAIARIFGKSIRKICSGIRLYCVEAVVKPRRRKPGGLSSSRSIHQNAAYHLG